MSYRASYNPVTLKILLNASFGLNLRFLIATRRLKNPFLFSYHHLVGIFPRSPPSREARLGPQRSWHILTAPYSWREGRGGTSMLGRLVILPDGRADSTRVFEGGPPRCGTAWGYYEPSGSVCTRQCSC